METAAVIIVIGLCAVMAGIITYQVGLLIDESNDSLDDCVDYDE